MKFGKKQEKVEKQPFVYFGIPCYGGMLSYVTVNSLLASVADLLQRGIMVSTDIRRSNCYIEHERNLHVDRFLKTDCTHLMFIDNDVGWKENIAVRQLLACDKDVIAGSYPYKNDEGRFPIQLETDENDLPVVDKACGALKCKGVPTGFLLIKRHVIEKLVAANQDRMYRAIEKKGQKDDRVCEIFTSVFDDGHRWGEDYSFCHKWQKLGGDVWCYPDITFTHCGFNEWEGNLHHYLLKNPADRHQEEQKTESAA